VSPSIPKTAPFAEDEIELLNRVVSPATPVQRAWLAGFLAGLDAASGGLSLAMAPEIQSAAGASKTRSPSTPTPTR
jgi:sulfite reductase (NADPH) flavoprotein alpha-component